MRPLAAFEDPGGPAVASEGCFMHTVPDHK